MMRNSPTALRVLKAALNAAEDGHAGVQVSPQHWSRFMLQCMAAFCSGGARGVHQGHRATV